ncbi:hypothetical protein E4T56_gene8753 [Termitomyces sp. T112]|nr:hypothetical protein E4T56_gene8753 [Termitomyces sp. T112]
MQLKPTSRSVDTFVHAGPRSVENRAVIWEELVLNPPVTLANDAIALCVLEAILKLARIKLSFYNLSMPRPNIST